MLLKILKILIFFFIYAYNTYPVTKNDTIKINSYEEFLNIVNNYKADEVGYLDMDALFLKEVPPELSKFLNLKTLSLNLNLLSEIPDFFSNYKQLTTLSLGSNSGFDLERLFEILSKTPNLEKLDLYLNRINTIPPSISKLKKLKYLGLAHNKIIYLPGEFDSLGVLSSLNLSDNPINVDSLTIIIRPLNNLKSLDLYSCNIKHFPLCMELFGNLEELILDGNDIDVIPDDIRLLKNLSSLQMAGNGLRNLSENIIELSQLKFLLITILPNINKSKIEFIKAKMPNCRIIVLSQE